MILTIITMLSTPILTSIFGDGSLEVCKGAINTNCNKNQNQGEDTEDWANYDVAAEEEEVIIIFWTRAMKVREPFKNV